MPVSNKIPGSPHEWLARAKSNLAIAMQKKPDEAYWEDLCYNTQLAAEKAIKAVLLHKEIPFRYVHDLEELITTLGRNNIAIPELIKESVILTQYAFETRYPGDYEPISESEYREAIDLAQQVVLWAESIIERKKETQ